jgi:drug/metabolite transporter (DMT)-like permease
MPFLSALRSRGVLAAFAAAILFGAGTPLAKLLVGGVNPWMLAGLLYLGSGLGLTIYRLAVRAPAVAMPRRDLPWLAGAVLCGGILAPGLLLTGLTGMAASAASLLLNAEGIFTALLAWFAFRENVDRRIALGMLAIAAGLAVVSWPHEALHAHLWPALSILGACLLWGLDNNLTRRVSLADATWVASIKGLVAGSVNLILALSLGARWPPLAAVASALLIGFLAYGVSLSLFVVALRHLGAARTGAYFSLAPFLGASIGLVLGDTLTLRLVLAALLMALGLWLHLTERHEHTHTHEPLEHEHEHIHDVHHQHEHDTAVAPGTRHSHLHRHEPLTHSHAHYPDAHHRHDH